MLYYSFKINSFPVPAHAFLLTTKNFDYKIPDKRGNTFEFAFIHHGEIEKTQGKKKYFIRGGDISFYVPNEIYYNKSLTEDELSFMSVGVNIDSFECDVYKCSDEEEWIKIRDELKDRLIIPSVMTIGKEASGIAKLMRVMINKYTEGSVTSMYSFVGDFLDILSYIDRETRKHLEGKMKASTTGIYIIKSKKYIERHYPEKVTVSDIAKTCKVSESYLCRLFKKETGKTMVEYLNEYRVNKAREIFKDNPGIKAEMVVQRVGFCDVRYMNIMFKRYLGVTIRDCRKIDGEISLHAKKTWENKIED